MANYTTRNHWELFCKKGVLRYAFASDSEVFWIAQRRPRKRFVMRKTEVHWHDYIFCWKCWGAPLSFLFVSWKIFFLILNELIGRHTQCSCKLRYSVEWLNILGSTAVLNLFLDQNSWIPVRINLFLFLIKWPGKK